MYLGRIVAIGKNAAGQSAAMYRVSSRSFPNREAVLCNGQVSIMPRAGFEGDLRKNPYITYNCVRVVNNIAVVSNGSHTDPIAEKIAQGMSVRDAMTLGLLAMDYEKDHLDTPRIVGAVSLDGDTGYLGIIRKDAVLVRKFELTAGKAFYISTYEHNAPCACQCDDAFDASNADALAQYVIDGGKFADFENPVTSAAALAVDGKFELSALVCE